MNRRRISQLSLTCYIIFLVLGLLTAAFMLVLLNRNNAGQSPEVGLLALVWALLMVLGLIYAAVAVIPLILRAVSIKHPSVAFPIICIPFDLAYVIFNGSYLYTAIADGGDFSELIFLIVFTLLSLLSLGLNILGIIIKD